MKIEPGLYPSFEMGEYLKLPAVSASILLDVLQRCPAAGWYNSWLNPKFVPDESTKAQSAGTVAHAILLEGNSDCCVVIDPNDYPAKGNGNIPKGWTNVAIQAARDEVIARGLVPMLPDDFRKVEAMVASAKSYIDSLRQTEPAIWRAFQPDGGASELTIVWDDGETPCRIRPDRASSDHGLMIDVKTTLTSAEPNTWGRTQMTKMGYYVSAAFYRRGVRKTFPEIADPAYVWLVIEQDAPYLCSLVGCDPQTEAVGDVKIDRAMRTWADCVRKATWPAYPNRVCYPELPPWESRDEGIDPVGIPYDPGKLWSKPPQESDPIFAA